MRKEETIKGKNSGEGEKGKEKKKLESWGGYTCITRQGGHMGQGSNTLNNQNKGGLAWKELKNTFSHQNYEGMKGKN